MRTSPFLSGQGPARRAVVVHVRRILWVRLAEGRVLHRRIRGRRQQGRKIHEKSRLYGPGTRKGEWYFTRRTLYPRYAIFFLNENLPKQKKKKTEQSKPGSRFSISIIMTITVHGVVVIKSRISRAIFNARKLGPSCIVMEFFQCFPPDYRIDPKTPLRHGVDLIDGRTLFFVFFYSDRRKS